MTNTDEGRGAPLACVALVVLAIVNALGFVVLDHKIEQAPKRCFVCGGAGEIDHVSQRYENGHACKVMSSEDCWHCRGTGTQRDALMERVTLEGTPVGATPALTWRCASAEPK